MFCRHYLYIKAHLFSPLGIFYAPYGYFHPVSVVYGSLFFQGAKFSFFNATSVALLRKTTPHFNWLLSRKVELGNVPRMHCFEVNRCIHVVSWCWVRVNSQFLGCANLTLKAMYHELTISKQPNANG